mgnify:CR=1 FL=1
MTKYKYSRFNSIHILFSLYQSHINSSIVINIIPNSFCCAFGLWFFFISVKRKNKYLMYEIPTTGNDIKLTWKRRIKAHTCTYICRLHWLRTCCFLGFWICEEYYIILKIINIKTNVIQDHRAGMEFLLLSFSISNPLHLLVIICIIY